MNKYTFIDFCSGIGGGRLGLEKAGFECIGFSEIDVAAIQTYKKLFNTKNELELGDLTKINPYELPNFDLLISGFPCQTFSIVGKREGFKDQDKGQIIFYLAEILKTKQPSFFILENVKGLVNHDKGNTLSTVLKLLYSVGYNVKYKILNSLDFSLAHNRERIYFVGIKKSLNCNFEFDFNKYPKRPLKTFLSPVENNILKGQKYNTFLKYIQNKYNHGKFCLNGLLEKNFLVLDTRQSDLRLYEDKIPTIRRNRQGICYIYNKNIYSLNKFEALRLQGFDKIDLLEDKINFLKESDILKQCGNAMSVNVIEAIAKKLIEIENKEVVMDKKDLGSQTAKNGFKNEYFVISVFNNWKKDNLAKFWLEEMGYDFKSIQDVKAEKIKGSFKSDVQVVILVQIRLQNLQDVQNLQVKLVSNPQGFNQIDKRWLIKYNELWNFPQDVFEILQYFVGEKTPKISNPRDKRRMFLTEFSEMEQLKVVNFFSQNQPLIVNDILKGRGQFSSEWFLVILQCDEKNMQWRLKPINEVINFYSGEVRITKQGSLKIGKITMQRKGGDGGRETANMLQFKINPCEIF